jgi:hypothetical protein
MVEICCSRRLPVQWRPVVVHRSINPGIICRAMSKSRPTIHVVESLVGRIPARRDPAGPEEVCFAIVPQGFYPWRMRCARVENRVPLRRVGDGTDNWPATNAVLAPALHRPRVGREQRAAGNTRLDDDNSAGTTSASMTVVRQRARAIHQIISLDELIGVVKSVYGRTEISECGIAAGDEILGFLADCLRLDCRMERKTACEAPQHWDGGLNTGEIAEF